MELFKRFRGRAHGGPSLERDGHDACCMKSRLALLFIVPYIGSISLPMLLQYLVILVMTNVFLMISYTSIIIPFHLIFSVNWVRFTNTDDDGAQ